MSESASDIVAKHTEPLAIIPMEAYGILRLALLAIPLLIIGQHLLLEFHAAGCNPQQTPTHSLLYMWRFNATVLWFEHA